MKCTPGIQQVFIDTVCARLAAGQRVRRTLPDWGRIHIDRQLPFLSVYRRPVDFEDGGTETLVMGEASYLIASGAKCQKEGLSNLARDVARTMKDAFGSALIVELWSRRNPRGDDNQFRIVVPASHRLGSTIAAFEQALAGEILVDDDDMEVDEVTIDEVARFSPPGLSALIPASEALREGIHVMGLEVNPTFRDEDGNLLPFLHRGMRKRIAQASKKGFFDFTRRHTTHRPPHFLALGPRAMVKAVWVADKHLAELSTSFDLILSVTPINAEEAWQAFRRSKYEQTPEFRYRPLPMDPSLLKRRLYKVPLEKIEDPTLANLFYAQQLEQDRKISLLASRGSPNFVLSSQQLYGPVDNALVETAKDILQRVTAKRKRRDVGVVDAETFASYATEELDYLRRTFPEIRSRAIVRRDVVGLVVSRGNLLISTSAVISSERVAALLAHEVGTHLVTYINACRQPFQLLYVGLPGYEEFQEGIACLAEYLAGGLDRTRMRLLAARVIAVRAMIDGGSFVDVYRLLHTEYYFARRTAFTIAMRAFRGGGFSKDAVYLRGLSRVLAHLGSGGHLDSLLVGKFNLEHVPIIDELRLRRVLGPPPLRPSYLDDPMARIRLDEVRSGMTVFDLVKRLPR